MILIFLVIFDFRFIVRRRWRYFVIVIVVVGRIGILYIVGAFIIRRKYLWSIVFELGF